MRFESNGYSYTIDENGVIHQENPQPYTYNNTYVATYDTEAYKRQSDILQALRLGFTLGSFGDKPNTLLDYGYGNGAFMKFAKQYIPEVYGYDLTGIPVDGCTIVDQVQPVDVITFWDALEHVPDLSFVQNLPCKMIVVSLPWCHFPNVEKHWFDELYKHRKPDEHLHHFNFESLQKMMYSYGWLSINHSHHEDIVRKSTHGMSNILSMAFKKVWI